MGELYPPTAVDFARNAADHAKTDLNKYRAETDSKLEFLLGQINELFLTVETLRTQVNMQDETIIRQEQAIRHLLDRMRNIYDQIPAAIGEPFILEDKPVTTFTLPAGTPPFTVKFGFSEQTVETQERIRREIREAMDQVRDTVETNFQLAKTRINGDDK